MKPIAAAPIHRSPLARMDDVVQIAKDEASDLARMGGDAG